MGRLIVAWLCLLTVWGPAEAQEEVVPEAVSDASPRASLQRFFDQTQRGLYDEAAEALDVPPGRREEAADLAKRLRAVLDRKLWIDLDSVSAQADGDTEDKLPSRFEELGRISGASGVSEPVRLVRSGGSEATGWRFSRATVDRIDGWYAALPDRWFMERLPQPLLAVGPLDLMWWQWLALPLLACFSALMGRVLGWASRKILLRIANQTTVQWDNALVARARGPLTLLWAIVTGYVMLPRLALLPPAQDLARAGLKSGVVIVLFWTVLRSIDLTSDMLAEAEALQSPAARSVLPIAARFAKVAVVAMLVIAVLSNFGLPVASLLAGLGVGGVALALAAQKTVENLFGAVSIGLDRPFRIGDLIKVGEVVGHVESIGLRSTRIRTLERTLLTVPNGGLADSRVESLAARDRMRLLTLIGLEYGTREETLRTVLRDIDGILRSEPRVRADSITVMFKEISAYALVVEVSAALSTSDSNEFQAWRQEALLSIMGVIERAGARLAFPTRTVHNFPSPSSTGTP